MRSSDGAYKEYMKSPNLKRLRFGYQTTDCAVFLTAALEIHDIYTHSQDLYLPVIQTCLLPLLIHTVDLMHVTGDVTSDECKAKEQNLAATDWRDRAAEKERQRLKSL